MYNQHPKCKILFDQINQPLFLNIIQCIISYKQTTQLHLQFMSMFSIIPITINQSLSFISIYQLFNTGNLQLLKMSNQKQKATLTNTKTKQITKSNLAHFSKKSAKNGTGKLAPKIQPQVQHEALIQDSDDINIGCIPYSHLIFSKNVNQKSILKHILQVFVGVNYGIRMRELTKEELQKYKFELPTVYNNKKTLFLDLDQTLIHTTIQSQKNFQHQVQLEINGLTKSLYFNLRPFACQFLKTLSYFYQIYIFTASSDQYARAIINFLNSDFKSISGYLCRQYCLKTSFGIYIKDLSRISNRNIKQMVLVDNLTHSFGNLIQNGIPILQFKQDKNDEQLIYLQKYLLEAATYDDIREYNRKYLKLREIVTLKQYFSK